MHVGCCLVWLIVYLHLLPLRILLVLVNLRRHVWNTIIISVNRPRHQLAAYQSRLSSTTLFGNYTMQADLGTPLGPEVLCNFSTMLCFRWTDSSTHRAIKENLLDVTRSRVSILQSSSVTCMFLFLTDE